MRSIEKKYRALIPEQIHEEAKLHEPKLPKPTLQKLDPCDDIEHYIAKFERITQQQKWPEDVWATQLAGLLTGKAMAAYASMDQEEAESYAKVKQAILKRYEVNEETHRQQFCQDQHRKDETYRVIKPSARALQQVEQGQ